MQETNTVVAIKNLSKIYAGGVHALADVSLDIREGEILALLGPNGAGKTTLISSICGLTIPTSGTILVAGFDVITQFRKARSMIGLVPQETVLDSFEKVIDTVEFSRGLFGKPANKKVIEQILRDLSLWDKRNSQVIQLSGGMKRRVLIAKALSHQPKILFLDEPTAGVDVELRKDMWNMVRALQNEGITIILTTHYIDEAEMMADRVGVINHGRLMLVQEKTLLMQQMGTKHMRMALHVPIKEVPQSLSRYNLQIEDAGNTLFYSYDIHAKNNEIASLLSDLNVAGVLLRDVQTSQSSLEDIFVTLVSNS